MTLCIPYRVAIMRRVLPESSSGSSNPIVMLSMLSIIKLWWYPPMIMSLAILMNFLWSWLLLFYIFKSNCFLSAETSFFSLIRILLSIFSPAVLRSSLLCFIFKDSLGTNCYFYLMTLFFDYFLLSLLSLAIFLISIEKKFLICFYIFLVSFYFSSPSSELSDLQISSSSSS